MILTRRMLRLSRPVSTFKHHVGPSLQLLQIERSNFERFGVNIGQSLRRYSSPPTQNSRTPLYPLHIEKGAKMVGYGGYEMPLMYSGHVQEHNAVRTSAGLFDVSHMVQTVFAGPTAADFLSSLLPTSLSSLSSSESTSGTPLYSSSLSVICNENGSIIDDLIVTKWGEDKFYVVTNAGRRERDLGWFSSHLKNWNEKSQEKVTMDVFQDCGLLALQGPESEKVLRPLIKTKNFDLKELTFGHSTFLEISIPSPHQNGKETDVLLHVSRGGYTGEDGFEISVPGILSIPLASSLLSSTIAPVLPSGLAARDSLRIEAGMCLYGNELSEERGISIAQAGLNWVVPKSRRRIGGGEGGFLGDEITIKEMKEGPKIRRIGILVEEGSGIARQGNKIWDEEKGGKEIGDVTSGIPSPTLGKNIAMGYIENGKHLKGNEIWIERRKGSKRMKAKIVGLPFVENKFWRGN